MKTTSLTELTTAPLTLLGNGWKVLTDKTAVRIKNELLDAAEGIVLVEDHPGAKIAKETRDHISRTLKMAEQFRKELKAPIIKAGDDLDDNVKAYVLELKQAQGRIDTLLGDFAKAEDVKRQEELRKVREAQEAAAALEAERIRKSEEAERLRIGAENAAAEAETPKERMEADEAVAEALERQRQSDALLSQQTTLHRSAYSSSLLAQQSVVKNVKPRLDYDVVDAKTLYAAAPDLVELSVKRRDVLAVLNKQADDGVVIGLPGITVKEVWGVRS